MRAVAGLGRRAPVAALTAAGGLLPIVAIAATRGVPARLVTGVAVLVVIAAFHRALLSWRSLLTMLVLLILFVPIKRYTLPFQVSGNFKLEPYRAFVSVVVLAWVLSLLADPRVRARASGLEWPFLLIATTTLGSVIVNFGSIQSLGVSTDVAKSLIFFASFFLVFYFVVSTVRSHADIDRVVKLFVAGGAAVATAAIVESKTQYNVFDHLRAVFPFLQFNVLVDPNSDLNQFTRGGEDRVFASAQHPIALSALLVMLLVVAIVYLILRPRQTSRWWPALLPMLVVIHFALPHTLGVLKSSLFPSGGVSALVTEQTAEAQSRRSSGRLADISPTIQQVSQTDPLLGVGFGSRVVEGPLANARILDDQWLDTVLETGFLGLFAWGWLLTRFLRRTFRAASEETGERGWFLVAVAASITAFAVGMFLFDAFGFTQETIVFFLLLGLGSVALRLRGQATPAQS